MSRKLKLGLTFVGLLVLARLVTTQEPNAPATPTAPEAPKAKVVASLDSQIWWLQGRAEDALKETMREPDSFKVVKWQRYGPGKGNSQIWGVTYRARNGFGGMNYEEKLFAFGPGPGDLRVAP